LDARAVGLDAGVEYCKSTRILRLICMPYKDKEKQRRAEREWYQRNKEERKEVFRQRSAAHRKKKREWMDGIKRDTPCAHCGKTYPPKVMDWHHRPEFDKSFEIAAAMAKNVPNEKIVEEIKKCELLCANCHRLVH